MTRTAPTFLTLLLAASYAPGQTTPKPAAAPETPTLNALNEETRRLCVTVSQGIVRIQFPALPSRPTATNPADNPLTKWDSKLDPSVRTLLELREREQALAAQGAPSGYFFVTSDGRPGLTPRDLPSPSPSAPGQSSPSVSASHVMFRSIGIVLDDDGHILLPFSVEKERLADAVVRVIADDGTLTTAAFRGTDTRTGLSLFQLERPCGRPIRLATSRPSEGSLVLLVSPDATAKRLGFWTSQFHPESALVVQLDGQLVGISRNGSFLGGPACQTVVDQLIQFGKVKRATLGVYIQELSKEDPYRDQHPVLHGRAAVFVRQVYADSPADRGGLKPNDIILALANEPVEDLPNFAAAITARQGPTKLHILRNDEETDITIDLQPQ